MTAWECTVCGDTQRSGKRGVCKACNARRQREWAARHRESERLRVAEYRAAHLDDVRASDRARYATDVVRRARVRAVLRRYQTVEAKLAHLAIYCAIKRGRLIRPGCCEQCEARCRPEAAHFDYADQLRVRWLCRSCHVKWDQAEPKVRLPY